MERASWFQFGLVGAEASGGGLMKRASCNSSPRLVALWLHEGSHGVVYST